MQDDWWLQPCAVFGHKFSGFSWHMPQKKVDSIAWLYQRAQPKESILYITLHSFYRLNIVLLVSAWKQGYRIRKHCILIRHPEFVHWRLSTKLTKTFWPRHFDHAILSTTLCPRPFVRHILSTSFCPLYFVHYILSAIFCPWHFVQWHFVHITFCPRHFVRGILSGDILSGHGQLRFALKMAKFDPLQRRPSEQIEKNIWHDWLCTSSTQII